jgi:hypothetical protein
MRYELTDHQWTAIRPMLPNKPRRATGERPACPQWHLPGFAIRSAMADLPDRLMEALAAAHDASVQMIDTSIVRVHQHGACIIRNRKQS